VRRTVGFELSDELRLFFVQVGKAELFNLGNTEANSALGVFFAIGGDGLGARHREWRGELTEKISTARLAGFAPGLQPLTTVSNIP